MEFYAREPAVRGKRDGVSAAFARRLVNHAAYGNVTAGLAGTARRFAKPSLLIPLIAFLVFALSRPYRGIVQDAYIYIGRALADLDPEGIGRDLMFVQDGQFGFSLFRHVTKVLVALWGPALAAKALAFSAALAWFFAAAAFAKQFAKGTAVWAVLIFAALLPVSYGAPYPFRIAELIAIPRPFAEALVLAGLAALAARRNVLSLLYLIVAALIHPIMALAGFGVFLAITGFEDKRLLLLCAAAGVLVILGGAFGLPLASRLFTPADPALKSLLMLRSPFLFPALWPGESFPPLAVEATVIAIAAHLQHGRAREILVAVIVVGLGGIAISAIFGDWLSSLLVIQVQPWRTAWLMAAAGVVSLALSAMELPKRGPPGHIVLSLLALCWCLRSEPLVALPAALLALELHFRAQHYAAVLTKRVAVATWIIVGIVCLGWTVRVASWYWGFLSAAPQGYGNPATLLNSDLFAFPLCALAAYCAAARPRLGPSLTGCFATLLAGAFICLWDNRPPAQRMLEEDQAPPEILRRVGERQGEILWIDGLSEPWILLQRPQWASPLQGIPIVFSPPLAAEWQRRTQILIGLHLADRKTFEPWSKPEKADRSKVSPEAIRQSCARSDAPAWIAVPLEQGTEPLAGLEMTLWRLPKPQFRLSKGDGEYVWQRVDAYQLIPCAGHEGH
ncbi:MAG: hypothetical protein L0Y50_07030 [Beijerinckiaceae bacterium]|nr:hypothetical protein [Beijerinckiaceae bacterium]